MLAHLQRLAVKHHTLGGQPVVFALHTIDREAEVVDPVIYGRLVHGLRTPCRVAVLAQLKAHSLSQHHRVLRDGVLRVKLAVADGRARPPVAPVDYLEAEVRRIEIDCPLNIRRRNPHVM